ncbi:MAG: alpha/beta hydrolase [Methylobacillus sp.]|nr:alpha/beta hydrolase [Methylobacillus sp.]
MLSFLIALAALLYAGICLEMYLAQEQLLYHPQAIQPGTPPPDFKLTRENGIILRGWVLNPGQDKALLYYGGNAESIEYNRALLAQWFPRRTIYLLPYRGYGVNDGKPSESALIADALALFDQTAKQHTAIAVIGRSLGSGVAAQLAARRPIERLLLVTPFDSMARVAATHYPWIPISLLMRDRFESWRYAGNIHCPVWLIRAGQDEVIPAERTATLVAAFPQPPIEYVIPDAGHNTVQNYADYEDVMRRFLAE